jgi:hypothetical protein
MLEVTLGSAAVLVVVADASVIAAEVLVGAGDASVVAGGAG